MQLKYFLIGAVVLAIPAISNGLLLDTGGSILLEKIAPHLSTFLCNLLNILNLRYTDADINVILQPLLQVVDQVVKFLSAGVCLKPCCKTNLALVTQSTEALHNANPPTFVEVDEVINNLLRYLLCLLNSLLGLGCAF